MQPTFHDIKMQIKCNQQFMKTFAADGQPGAAATLFSDKS